MKQFNSLTEMIGSLHGKTVLEVGPGDAIVLAPLFIRAGAKRYVAIDRFLGDMYATPHADALYTELRKVVTLPPDWKRHVDGYRVPIETAQESLREVADVIVSYNVLEHLHDLRAAFRSMALLLKKDGVMSHRIDYAPHDIWRSCANPLEFLTVPDWLWALMGSNRGIPNRVRHGVVMRALAEVGFVTQAQITDVASEHHVRAILPKLAKSLAGCTEDDLRPLGARLFSRLC